MASKQLPTLIVGHSPNQLRALESWESIAYILYYPSVKSQGFW